MSRSFPPQYDGMHFVCEAGVIITHINFIMDLNSFIATAPLAVFQKVPTEKPNYKSYCVQCAARKCPEVFPQYDGMHFVCKADVTITHINQTFFLFLFLFESSDRIFLQATDYKSSCVQCVTKRCPEVLPPNMMGCNNNPHKLHNEHNLFHCCDTPCLHQIKKKNCLLHFGPKVFFKLFKLFYY